MFVWLFHIFLLRIGPFGLSLAIWSSSNQYLETIISYTRVFLSTLKQKRRWNNSGCSSPTNGQTCKESAVFNSSLSAGVCSRKVCSVVLYILLRDECIWHGGLFPCWKIYEWVKYVWSVRNLAKAFSCNPFALEDKYDFLALFSERNVAVSSSSSLHFISPKRIVILLP